MTFADAVALALRNLRQARLRTALTVLGVTIGIASLAGMVSLGVGLQDQLVGRFMRSGLFDAITVLPARPAGAALFGRVGPGGRRGGAAGARAGRAAAAPDAPEPSLDDAAIDAIRALAEVRDVYPNVRVPVEVRLDDSSAVATATGIPESSRDDGPFRTFAHGGFFPDRDAAACILTMDMVRRLTDAEPGELVGREIRLVYAASAPAAGAEGSGRVEVRRVEAPVRVAGIIEREPVPGLGAGAALSGVLIPLALAREIDLRIVTSAQALFRAPAAGEKAYTSLTVRVTRAQVTGDVQERIRAMGFTTFSLNDALEGAKRAFLILDLILGLVGSIALAVSSLGIVNTMVMSILERTREIGVMKAVGGSDGDIRRIFLVEASVIGVAGGVAGVALGWLVGRVINFGANLYIESQGGDAGNLFALPWWLIGGAIGFSWVISLLAGSYPARRAARLDPIRALRHD